MTVQIRAASTADRTTVDALIAREVRAGTVLHRDFVPSEFLVAEHRGRVVGALSTTPWTAAVVELGTVIATTPGRGTGRALVAAGLARADRWGADWTVVLTRVPRFFSRQGFEAVADAPWARARGPAAMTEGDADLSAAVGTKAARSCRTCPFLSTCEQSLLARRMPSAEAVWRACA
jgi:N-acetylglutamate synthase-like GNAT family acetyltransferase